jgi:hypothetical protein
MSLKSNAPRGEDNEKSWFIEIGLYPGVLFGIRSYDMENGKMHVFYLPFVDIIYYHE